MKFIKVSPEKGLVVPMPELKKAKLDGEKVLRVVVNDDMTVLMKKELTAMDLLHAAYSFYTLGNSMMKVITDVCGSCKDCDKCESCDGPTMDDFEPIKIPKAMLSAAGIDNDARLCADIDPENGVVTVMECDAENVLSDIPHFLTYGLLANKICVIELEEMLAAGEVVVDD